MHLRLKQKHIPSWKLTARTIYQQENRILETFPLEVLLLLIGGPKKRSPLKIPLKIHMDTKDSMVAGRMYCSFSYHGVILDNYISYLSLVFQIPPQVWCFRYVFGVQIPPYKVFGSLGYVKFQGGISPVPFLLIPSFRTILPMTTPWAFDQGAPITAIHIAHSRRLR